MAHLRRCCEFIVAYVSFLFRSSSAERGGDLRLREAGSVPPLRAPSPVRSPAAKTRRVVESLKLKCSPSNFIVCVEEIKYCLTAGDSRSSDDLLFLNCMFIRESILIEGRGI